MIWLATSRRSAELALPPAGGTGRRGQFDAAQPRRRRASYEVYGFDSCWQRSRRLSTKAITSADCSGVRIRFGIFGCGVCRKARRAVAVIPDVLAMVGKSGAIAIVLCERCSAVTAWQGEHASRAYTRPTSEFPPTSWAFAA